VGLSATHSIPTTTGDWREQDPKEVEAAIYKAAGKINLKPARKLVDRASAQFDIDKGEVLSIITTALSASPDPFLDTLKAEAGELSILSRSDVIKGFLGPLEFGTRDSVAAGQGLRTPPHIEVLAETLLLRQPAVACGQLAKIARKAGSHISRQLRQKRRSSMVGTNVFIGHGRSLVWKELRDFIRDRVKLPFDEFNRVPIAGTTNVARLSEMLDAAAIAFVILTGEDELADGKLQARQNAVHEAGLFQGRLGFGRAIILLEEGCEEFGNIQGLGQIRFPKGNISAAFEEVRRVLEREELIGS
jgi:predicted nucleotide-binding protein